ncbi:MAG: radical SAM protein [Tepidibacter sp.]|jgi:radical SAM enzyme (TIGR01210 family)|uniref:elongator complex protein 3 n=1 Tax=Tepidibacter sp. TaxID=2529387 RepID=UPI0025FE0D33|nr:radical SAM protein [Tepidibacter sp.]MCT4509815.1 radical SAM protein [Tepidibacter sp.]
MKRRIIPVFVPHKGCPHDCIFCNQKKITGVSTDVSASDVENIIEQYLKTMTDDLHIEVAFFGGSFTAIDINIQKKLLSVAKQYVDKGRIKDIRLSTRPDCIDEVILDNLKKHKVSIIELGVQSMDDDVLEQSIRGHSQEDVLNAVKLIKEYDFELGLQMMLGLPSDTEQKCIQTADKFINLRPSFVRIYPTLVVKDTGLESLYNESKYTPFDLDTTIEISKKLLIKFQLENIKVIRVGLQTTEDISLGRDVVCGPHHPSLRELIEARIYRDYIENIIKSSNIEDSITVYVNKKNISKIVGNKKNNIIYLYERYNVNMSVKEEDLPIDEFLFKYNEVLRKTSLGEIYKNLYDIYKI